jgi:hypothetical protein
MSVTRAPLPSTRLAVKVTRHHDGGVRIIDHTLPPTVASADQAANLEAIFASLTAGDTVEFPADAAIQVDSAVDISDLTDVTVEGHGARFFTSLNRSTSFFAFDDCTNLTLRGMRIFGYRPETHNGSTFDTVVGTPTTSGSTKLLDAQYECVEWPNANFHARDKDGAIKFDFSLSDSAQVADDCVIEVLDSDGPTTGLSAAAVGTQGGIPAGTFEYRVSYIDREGRETTPSLPAYVTLATPGVVDLTLPTAADSALPPVVARRIYRTVAGGSTLLWVDDVLDNSTTTYQDNRPDSTSGQPLTAPTCTQGAAGNVEAGTHFWKVTYVITGGRETTSQTGGDVELTVASEVELTNIPVGGATVTKRRIYRTPVTDSTSPPNDEYLFVAEIADNVTTTYTDDTADGDLGEKLPSDLFGSLQPKRYAYETLSLTGTPTTYSLSWVPGDGLDRMLAPVVYKATATANTITLTSASSYGRVTYVSNVESSHGFNIRAANTNIVIEDCQVEGVGGDFFSSGEQDTKGVTVRRSLSRGCRRQGMSFTAGQDYLIEGCVIREPGRSNIDIEPQLIETVRRATIRDCEIWAGSNWGIAADNWHAIEELTIRDVQFLGSGPQTNGFLVGGSDHLVVKDCVGKYWPCALSGRDISVDGLWASRLTLRSETRFFYLGEKTSGGGTVSNIRLGDTDWEHALSVVMPRVSVQNVSMMSKDDSPIEAGRIRIVPFELASDTVYSGLDPGFWRTQFDSTYKGIASKPWFPRGLDLLEDPVIQARSLSGGTTRGNNLRGIGVTLGNGVSTKAVTFSTRSQTNPSSFTLSAREDDGSLSTTTYYYRVAGRSVSGGPAIALAEKNVTLSGAQDSVRVSVVGLGQEPVWIEGVTIYRGTSAGVYDTRYDIIPNADFHGLGLGSASTTFQFLDLGTTVELESENYVGYPASFEVTAGGPFTAGTDQTGYETDTSYDVWVTTSFDNGGFWITSKAVSGFTVNWTTATADADQTLSWLVVR